MIFAFLNRWFAQRDHDRFAHVDQQIAQGLFSLLLIETILRDHDRETENVSVPVELVPTLRAWIA